MCGVYASWAVLKTEPISETFLVVFGGIHVGGKYCFSQTPPRGVQDYVCGALDSLTPRGPWFDTSRRALGSVRRFTTVFFFSNKLQKRGIFSEAIQEVS